MRTPLAVSVFVGVLVCLATLAHSRTWYVPGDAPTIQAGVDSASAGDTVIVESGTYFEYEITINAKSGLVLTSETGEADCVTIDATNPSLGGVMQCLDVDGTTLVKGFTMINGYRTYDAGGVFCNQADVVFENCVIANNECGERGGGAMCTNCSPTFLNCTICDNSNGWLAGWGGGIHCLNASPTITNTIIAFNTPGAAVEGEPTSSPVLTCCDLYGNAGGDWVNIIADQADVNGNFSADPVFCNRGSGDYYLRCNSPCLEGSGCGLVGALGLGGNRAWRVPSEAPTIQAGIDSACGGDTVIVASGTYFEYEITINAKSGLVLTSETGEADCVTIDATNPSLGGVMQCLDVDGTTLVKGFTMINGYRTYDAGGVFCNQADVVFENCIIANNQCGQMGGGATCTSCSPTFLHCTICDNHAGLGWGAGIHCIDASPSFTNTIIAFNTTGSAMICIGASYPTLTCCDVYGNLSDWEGYIASQAGVNGNFSADPLFCDAGSDNFGLDYASPCLPGNHPDEYDCGSQIGACDWACGSPVQPTTWGAIKAIYR